jgi:hypothetical protein
MLFEKAKKVGLGYIKEWLPNGKQEGSEWITLNPTRKDNHLGSFKINLKTGIWSDFSYDSSGPDTVSLYAYLFHSECSDRAIKKKYKNLIGGIQTEAARLILEKYDPSYFPSKDDQFIIPQKKADYWDGWSQMLKGIDEPPSVDDTIEWMVNKAKIGNVKSKWIFNDKKGKILFYVVRHVNGKKDDRPYTLWHNGVEYRWRCKGFKDSCKNGFKIPLHNLPDILSRENDPIAMFEGQKKSAAAKKMIGEEWICTSFYGGGLDNIDFEPLRGRKIWYWFDPDYAGRKKLIKIKEKLKEIDCAVVLVPSPVGKPPGWDVADAIDEGWTKEQIIEHLKAEKERNVFIDDNPFPFKIVGLSGNDAVFYPFGSKRIVRYRLSSLTKNCLMTLADRKIWGEFYAKDKGGIAWDSAVNDLIRSAHRSPIFDPLKIRGSGAWIDNGKITINTGEKLLIDNKEIELFENDTDCIYEKSRKLPYRKNKPLKKSEAQKLTRIIDLLPFKKESYKKILAGWILLSPWGGLLKWRPHIWLVGGSGTGKTWILQNIMYKICAVPFGIKGQGTSTPAGLRQSLASCAINSVLDEMESDNKINASYIDQNLKMYREGSAGSDMNSPTLHGTSDGEGKQWYIYSMACFASIGANIKHGADMNRFTLLTLNKKKKENIIEDDKQFMKLVEKAKIFTSVWCESFHARTANMLPELLKCIDVMVNQATAILGNRRDGDQIGTLFAGSWMIDNDISCTAAEAKEYLINFAIKNINIEHEMKADEEMLLDEILSSTIQISDGVKRSTVTIGTAINYWFSQKGIGDPIDFPGANIQEIKRVLEQYGIKPMIDDGVFLQIATTHSKIKELLKNTHWQDVYSELLGRLDYCDDKVYGPGNFAGVRKRYRKLNIRRIVDEIPF